MFLAAGLATVITVTQVSGVTINGTDRGYTDVPCQGDRRVIVHLFEWPWDDIADSVSHILDPRATVECRYLHPWSTFLDLPGGQDTSLCHTNLRAGLATGSSS